MKIRVFSDLHTELQPYSPAQLTDRYPPEKAVVILAGDIGSGANAIHWARANFASAGRTLFVPGNHEYYHRALSATALEMKRAAEGSNVVVLDNDSLVVDDVRFLGTSLWSDFALHGEGENRAHAIAVARNCMNDFQCIRYGTAWLTPEQTIFFHRTAVEWLKTELSKSFPGRTVVITHHAPHPGSCADEYLRDPITPSFISDLTYLMGPHIKLWCHGHTHRAFDYVANGTRIVCNPKGYDGERTGFDPYLVVEV